MNNQAGKLLQLVEEFVSTPQQDANESSSSKRIHRSKTDNLPVNLSEQPPEHEENRFSPEKGIIKNLQTEISEAWKTTGVLVDESINFLKSPLVPESGLRVRLIFDEVIEGIRKISMLMGQLFGSTTKEVSNNGSPRRKD